MMLFFFFIIFNIFSSQNKEKNYKLGLLESFDLQIYKENIKEKINETLLSILNKKTLGRRENNFIDFFSDLISYNLVLYINKNPEQNIEIYKRTAAKLTSDCAFSIMSLLLSEIFEKAYTDKDDFSGLFESDYIDKDFANFFISFFLKYLAYIKIDVDVYPDVSKYLTTFLEKVLISKNINFLENKKFKTLIYVLNFISSTKNIGLMLNQKIIKKGTIFDGIKKFFKYSPVKKQIIKMTKNLIEEKEKRELILEKGTVLFSVGVDLYKTFDNDFIKYLKNFNNLEKDEKKNEYKAFIFSFIKTIFEKYSVDCITYFLTKTINDKIERKIPLKLIKDSIKATSNLLLKNVFTEPIEKMLFEQFKINKDIKNNKNISGVAGDLAGILYDFQKDFIASEFLDFKIR